jgi:hypothetical protein
MFLEARKVMTLNWPSKPLALIVVSLSFLGASGTEKRDKREPESRLQLAVKIVSSEYCRADPELDSLRLKLKLTFTNRRKEPLILYKGSSLVSRIMISRNSADAAAKRFEVSSLLTQLTSGASRCYKGAIPTSCFVVLPPGASFEIETVVGVFAVRGDAREIAGAVKSGDHLLQVEVVTWHESDELAKNLQARWLRHGLLWYEPITSAPVEFTVSLNRNVVDCP